MAATDPISESSDGNEASHSIELQRELSNSTVPGTPGADSPNSLVIGSSSPLVRQGAAPFSHMGKGTSLAIGALKPSSFSHIVTPFPIHTHRPSKLSASFTFSSPSMSSVQRDYMARNRDSGNTSDVMASSDSQSDEDSEREEVQLLLKVVRSQRYVHQLEKDVIIAQVEENAAIGELYKFRAVRAQKKLGTTEHDLGHLRNAIRKSGISLADLPSTRKRRRMLNDSPPDVSESPEV